MRFLPSDLHPQFWSPFVVPSGVTRSVLTHVDSPVHHDGNYPSLTAAYDSSSSWISYRFSVSWTEWTCLLVQGVSLCE